MWINTFDIAPRYSGLGTADTKLTYTGEVWLFDNALMIAEINVKGNDGTNYVIFKSGGQDGMMKWLRQNNYELSWKSIKRTQVPSTDQKTKIRMAMDSKLGLVDLGDGRFLNKSDIMTHWAINEVGHKNMSSKIGALQPKETNRTYVVVVDGSIAAFMPMEAFQNPQYGITDYEGGGHNFWIPFMMSGGRSGTGYIMTTEVPQLQANILLKALKNQTKGDKMQEILGYVLNNSPMAPLPEFQPRLKWLAQTAQEIMDEQGIDAEQANQQVLNKLMRAIKAKNPEVFDNNFTLDGGYVVEGREYEWPKP